MPVTSVRQAKELRVSASFVPDTLNLEKRTIDVVFATETPVLMGWYERFFEVLSFDPGHCDYSRLNAGAPLLDSHNKYAGTENLPGVVERGWTQDGKGYATLRFSNDAGKNGQPDGPGEKIMQRVSEGVVRNISVGYNVFEYEEVDSAGSQSVGVAKENKIPTYRAINWQPYEISFVPVPADYNAGVRSAGDVLPPAIEIKLITHNQSPTMLKRQLDAGTPGEGGGGGVTVPVGGGERGAQPPAPIAAAPAAAAPAPAAQPDGGTRAMEIMDACNTAKLPLEFARELMANSKDISQCRALIIEKLAGGSNAVAPAGGNRSITVGADESDARRLGIADALLHRAMPSLHKLTEPGKQYRSLSLFEMGRDCLEAVTPGITRGLSRSEVAQASLGLRAGGMMATSDFPIILGNVINRTLRQQYESRVSEWRPFCRQSTAKDFRTKTVVQLSEGGFFDKIEEGGEYKNDYLSESKESYRVFKYGKKIGITWETIINDDLDFIGRIPQIVVDMAVRAQDDIVWSIPNSNPLMGDGVALFHATHGNLVTGSVISVDNLGLARLAMRNQKGMRGNQFLNLTPSYLVVGPNLEQIALQYMSSAFNPTTPGTVNPWQASMKIIVEPRITDNRWYLIAAPSSIDTIEYAFLEGEGELFTTMREGWDVDGIEMKARMVFGAKAIDWRGFVKNPGV